MPLGACPLNSRLLHTQDRIRLWSGLLIASALMAAIAAEATPDLNRSRLARILHP